MAAELPAQYLQVHERWFRRGIPIRSGASAAAPDDRPYGYRGLSAEINAVYAYAVRDVISIPYAPDGAAQIVDTSAAYTTASKALVRWGADVTTVDLVVDLKGGDVRISVDDNAAGTITAVATPAVYTTREIVTVSLTLTDTTGYEGWLMIEWQKTAPGTQLELYALVVREIALTAGEIP